MNTPNLKKVKLSSLNARTRDIAECFALAWGTKVITNEQEVYVSEKETNLRKITVIYTDDGYRIDENTSMPFRLTH
jgi:hypothetical protein